MAEAGVPFMAPEALAALKTVPKERWLRYAKRFGKKRTIWVLGTPLKLRLLQAKPHTWPAFRKQYTVAHPVPWDTTVFGPAAIANLSAAQKAINEEFARHASAMKGKHPFIRRMYIAAQMTAPEKPYSKYRKRTTLSYAELARAIGAA